MVKENVKPKSQIEFFINKSAKEFNNDTKIYRYMDFDCFLQILDKKFYISAKKHFSDCYDAGTKVPLKDIFKNFVNVCEGKSVVLKNYTSIELIEMFKKSQNYLTSCWTLNKDDILMWQAYTHGNCGICIESTVGNVIAALDPNAIKPYLICCSPMYYNGYSSLQEVEGILFQKQNQYKGEKEVRFYFLNGIFNDESVNYDKNYAVFDIDSDVLIDEVILSPFMRGNSAQVLKHKLEESNPYLEGRIYKSEISL